MSEENHNDTTASDDLKARAYALVGRTISQRYRIDELIAFGGMGTIYRGEHVLMRKRLAVKVLQNGVDDLPRLAERFRREAIVGAHLSHPNVASATDFGQLDDGSYFLVMEHIKGRTLYELMAEEGALPVDRATGIARQVAAGLLAAHEIGVVHRDIKPHNIMLVEFDATRTASVPALPLGRDYVKLIDFGVARLAEDRLSLPPSARASSIVPERITPQGEIFGTIAYLAPEAAAGMDAVDERSDLYALGVVLYQMLTGLHPFAETEPAKIFRAHLLTPPPSFAVRAPQVQVPEAVEALTLRLLEKDPSRRFQDASSLIQAIDEAMGLTALYPGRISTPALSPDLLAEAFRRETAARESSPAPAPAAPAPAAPAPAAPALLAAEPAAPASLSPDEVAAFRSRRWMVVPAIGVVALAAAGIAAMQAGDAPTAPAGSASASASAPAALSVEPAPAASASAAPRGPTEDPTAWKIRLKSSVRVHDWPNARLSFRRLAEIAPESLADPVYLPSVVDMITSIGHNSSPEADEIFDLLENRTGPSGLDVLYDVVQRKGGSLAATRATEILKKPAVLARASAPMRVAFELRTAPCSEKSAILDRVGADGDWRSIHAFDGVRAACGRSVNVDEARRKILARMRK